MFTRIRVLVVLAAAMLAACAVPAVTNAFASSTAAAAATTDPSAGKIKHIIWIMQENRSFDNYFGTYPGANGIPSDGAGHFLSSTCEYDPVKPDTPACPYHNYSDTNSGGDHSSSSTIRDINDGAMDGFQAEARRSYQHYTCAEDNKAACNQTVDAMGYHDAREIPNYWQYAQHYGLADNAFEFTPSYSLPSHLYMVSEWSGDCRRPNGVWVNSPTKCTYNIDHPSGPTLMTNCENGIRTAYTCPIFAWTSMTYLLHQVDKSWAYYIEPGAVSDCTDLTPAQPDACSSGETQGAATSNIWNPLTYFPDVDETNQRANIKDSKRYFASAADGTLPAVSWIVPTAFTSEHPNQGLAGKSIHEGQRWVTSLINAAMSGPDWNSTAIFVTWDDWGGFYDHVPPPNWDSLNRQEQAGIRVPMLIISPFAKPGVVNHRELGLDSINRFIEDVFLGSQRLDPLTDGRPDSRGVVGEMRSWTGDLSNSFNFNQTPLDPLVLSTNPLPGKPSCIDGITCDDFYISSMSPRNTTSSVAREITLIAPGVKAGVQLRIDARSRLNVIAGTVKSVNETTHRVVLSVKPGKNVRSARYSVVLTNPDGAIASCNGCLTNTHP